MTRLVHNLSRALSDLLITWLTPGQCAKALHCMVGLWFMPGMTTVDLSANNVIQEVDRTAAGIEKALLVIQRSHIIDRLN